MKILFATQNKGKQEEFRLFADDLGITAIFPGDIEEIINLDPEETGKTFSENAFIKAKEFGDLANMITLADDSGLEVTALDGFPGVNSARWMDGTVQEKNLALLDKMEEEKDRSARYVGVLCLYDPNNANKVNYFKGICTGKIRFEEEGTSGFGYDPIFVPTGYLKTFGDLPDDVKSKVSHRALAMKKLKRFLQNRNIVK